MRCDVPWLRPWPATAAVHLARGRWDVIVVLVAVAVARVFVRGALVVRLLDRARDGRIFVVRWIRDGRRAARKQHRRDERDKTDETRDSSLHDSDSSPPSMSRTSSVTSFPRFRAPRTVLGEETVLLHELRKSRSFHPKEDGGSRDVPVRLDDGAGDAAALDRALHGVKRDRAAADQRIHRIDGILAARRRSGARTAGGDIAVVRRRRALISDP